MFEEENYAKYPMKKEFEEFKKIKILVIGDRKTCKTSFLQIFCKTYSEIINMKETVGCDIHLKFHAINANQLTEQERKQQIHPEKLNGKEYLIEFQDISGEFTQRNGVLAQISNYLREFKAILYFFDASNLKTLSSLFYWLKLLFKPKKQQSNQEFVQNVMWEIPFMLIGTKVNLVENITQKKQKIFETIKNIFNCETGENLVLLSINNWEFYSIEINFIEMFLTQICLESELNIERDSNSEQNRNLASKNFHKDTAKYMIRTSVTLNEFRFQRTQWENIENAYFLFIEGARKIKAICTNLLFSKRKSRKQNASTV